MLRREEGVTLVEVVAAFVILSIVALLTTRTLTTASATLTRTSEQTLQAQEAMRWVRLARYDVQGSTDLYIFGPNLPRVANQTLMCSKLRSESNQTNAWNAIGSVAFPVVAGVRPLFTVQVKDVNYDRSSNSSVAYLPARWTWVGYEIRRAAAVGEDTPYELWRVTCADAAGSSSSEATGAAPNLSSQERVLDLGKTLDESVSGLNVVACPTRNGNGLTFCPEAGTDAGSGTTAQIPWYSLSLPFSKVQGQLINRDSATLLNAVTRMVGK